MESRVLSGFCLSVVRFCVCVVNWSTVECFGLPMVGFECF